MRWLREWALRPPKVYSGNEEVPLWVLCQPDTIFDFANGEARNQRLGLRYQNCSVDWLGWHLLATEQENADFEPPSLLKEVPMINSSNTSQKQVVVGYAELGTSS